jgi:hypothetical protein
MPIGNPDVSPRIFFPKLQASLGIETRLAFWFASINALRQVGQ